jgi:hypothetical protein
MELGVHETLCDILLQFKHIQMKGANRLKVPA